MNGGIYDYFCQPETKDSLRYINDRGCEYYAAKDGGRYLIEDGIVRFLESGLTGNNKAYQRLYDRLAPFYDTVMKTYALLKDGGERKRVVQYLCELEVKKGDAVLEISVGTGRNIAYLEPEAVYFGVDISLGMLKKCRRGMRRLGRDITLLQAEAESLPLKDDVFDVVFSAGGFNFYNDRKKAVEEMLRVAKSGTKLMIYDETEKARSKFEKTPVSGSFYSNAQITDPAAYIPAWCEDLNYREICGGELYVLTFRKP